VDDAVAELRVRLLVEEVDEYAAASRSKDLVGIADALADIVYVAYGAALTYGIDLDVVLSEVHRANMSKLDADGRPSYRSDGKVVKSPRYSPPDVKGVLARQSALPLAAR
jgi:predicted HAD superfamily Cof-like phosphohydrolase